MGTAELRGLWAVLEGQGGQDMDSSGTDPPEGLPEGVKLSWALAGAHSGQ